MNDGSMSAVVVSSLVEAQPSSNVLPTVEQTARFEQLLHYESPSAGAHGLAGGWHSLMDEVGQVSKDARAGLDSFDSQDVAALDPQQTAPTDGADRIVPMLSHLVHFSRSMLTVSLVSTGERMTIEGMRTLYQQQS